MKNMLNRNSISRKLATLTIIALLPALAIVLYTGFEQRSQSIANAKQDVLLISRNMAEVQKDLTASARQILSTLALLPEIREVNPQAARAILAAVLKQNPQYLNIVLTDLQGEVLAAGGAFVPANLGDRQHFQDALEHKQFTVGEFIIARIGVTEPALAFAHPVFGPAGQVTAVLSTSIALDRFARLYDVSHLPEKSFVAITDRQGIRLFYHPPRDATNPIGQPIRQYSWEIARTASAPEIFFGEGSDGVRRIIAVEQIRLSPAEQPYIYVWAGVPADHIVEPANAVLLRNLLLLFLAAAISLGIAAYLGRVTLVAPIAELDGLTRKFAAGYLEARVRLEKMPSEIAALANAFHEMAAELARSQNILRDSEARFRLLMDSLDALVYVTDLNNYEILFINQVGIRQFGDVTGKVCWQTLRKAQPGPCLLCPRRYDRDEKSQPDGIHTWEMENTVTGQWHYLRDRAIEWIDGRVVRLVVATDISERKQAEIKLAEERERLAVTLASIGDGVIATDTAGRVVIINQVAETLTGWSGAAAVGRPLAEVFPIVTAATGAPCDSPVEKVISSGKLVCLEQQTILRAQDGRERQIADSGAPIKDKNGNIIGVVLVFRDITEQLRTEEELLKVKKLESIGVLAGGLAHDFNNILTAISGNLQLALRERQLPEDSRELLEEAVKASQRARNLTGQLLTFAKGGQPIRETASLEEVIRDSAEFVLRGSKSACRYHFPADLWLVDIDKGQISQVVQNLILNAVEAMPDGGNIEVTCENVGSAAVKLALPAPGDYVRMSVKDHGVGIPANVLDRLFDPYYSTKQQGSGLGLAICHSIVSKHDGRITVDSSPGHGATFSVYLPAARQGDAARPEAARIASPAREARILVMDDEEMIRDLARVLLAKMGHEVMTAADGVEAVRLYREALAAGKRIDLVIMDMTIPGGMGGQEAVGKILDLDPGAKVIVTSGYSNDQIMANFQDYGFRAALAKPFEIEELLEVVNRQLA
ncbi:ATP-binding protein [Desulfurivibrio sp. C05AmB]|uniref:ATP-binding protein n=1 Tax=Desulfurivibrio sp. C05AmB TaxID=3374371 RepID=UPI00376F05E8